MKPERRVVTQLPIEQLHDGAVAVAARRLRSVSRDEAATLIADPDLAVVVATLGAPLRWIDAGAKFELWKREASPRILPPESPVDLQALPDGYGYWASLWERGSEGEGRGGVLLLEKVH